jgi:hypothetical protein
MQAPQNTTPYSTHIFLFDQKVIEEKWELNNSTQLHWIYGCAIAQAVSRWLPTVAARIRNRVWPCGIYGGQSGAGAGFL